jgi:hypothetical protein
MVDEMVRRCVVLWNEHKQAFLRPGVLMEWRDKMFQDELSLNRLSRNSGMLNKFSATKILTFKVIQERRA